MPNGANRRIIAVAPMPPEKSAYALARYSRSPDSIEDSLRWVHGHSSEKFWQQFYYAYGHASIADLGHVTICFENISELAAIHLEDEPLWDGQAKSSRYQNFGSDDWFVPSSIQGTEAEDVYYGILGILNKAYSRLHDPLKRFLAERTPPPSTMKLVDYERIIAARAFDATRYLLPLAARTNVGQVVSIRTLEKQITRLLSTNIPELRSIGEELKEACQRPPVNVWSELTNQVGTIAEPLAPTLARHAHSNSYLTEVYSELSRYALKVLKSAWPEQNSSWASASTTEQVDLIEPHHPLDELTATLLYKGSHVTYRQILSLVQGWPDNKKQEVVELALKRRTPKDELIKEFRCGYAFIFDILMDIGAWRDLHRHRRCQQIQQNFTTLHGYDVPLPLVEAGLAVDYRSAMDAVQEGIHQIATSHPEAAFYAIPFGFKVRCLFKMDYAEAEYISQLRSGVKGHWSYRGVAWQMKQKLTERYPFLGNLIQATPPDQEDSLTR